MINYSHHTSTVIQDRFIPLRESTLNDCVFSYNLQGEKKANRLANILPLRPNQLRFNRTKENVLIPNEEKDLDPFSGSNSFKIERQPIKMLEAPALMDDYYLSLVAWSRKNIIGVGLDETIYLFNFLSNSVMTHFALNQTKKHDSFRDTRDSTSLYLCSLIYEDDGNSLAVGDSLGQIHITDVERNKMVSSSFAHTNRIGSLHWQENIIVSGSRDNTVRLFDVRQNTANPIFTFAGHNQEICGLKLSPDNSYIASGGNDNRLLLWDIRKMKLMGVLGEHNAAVKALAWCPRKRSILVSGAGTADRKLRVFDTSKEECISISDTGSQVCNLSFDPEGECLISTHGYSLNQLIVWNHSRNYDYFRKEDVLIAHKLRVLYLATSPCGKYAVTGAGDETIRVWGINRRFRRPQSCLGVGMFNIR